MHKKILITVTDPKNGEREPLEFSQSFTIGSRKPYDIVIDGEFIETLHGIFDYSDDNEWYYIDSAGILFPTVIKRANNETVICSTTNPTKIRTGDVLILNKVVNLKILRAIDKHDNIIN